MNQEVLLALVKIVFGSLAGGLTNTVAVWMLFHPYEPPKLLGRWRISFLHGAVPKNQPRLAAAIGRTVGNRLLTPKDLRRPSRTLNSGRRLTGAWARSLKRSFTRNVARSKSSYQKQSLLNSMP